MLFESHHYGKPISEQLSEYLKEFTNNNDRANVSEKTNVGTSIIRDVVYRSRTVTENNSEAIIELMRIAIYNCTHKIERATEAKDYLTEQLITEEQHA